MRRASEGRDEIDLEDDLFDDIPQTSSHGYRDASSSGGSYTSVSASTVTSINPPVTPRVQHTTQAVANHWAKNQEPAVSQPSLTEIIREETQHQQNSEAEAERIAELAQEEELMRVAMEMSLSEVEYSSHSATSYGNSITSNSMNSEEVVIREYGTSEEDQLEMALRLSRHQHTARAPALGTLQEEDMRPSSPANSETKATTDASTPITASRPPLGGRQSSLSSLISPRTPTSRDTPDSPSFSSDTPPPSSHRPSLLRNLGSSFPSLEELSPAELSGPLRPKPGSRRDLYRSESESGPTDPDVGAGETPESTPDKSVESKQGLQEEYDLSGADEHLSVIERKQIEQALKNNHEEDSVSASEGLAEPASLSEAEARAIEKALREADQAEENRSLLLALQMQEEEQSRRSQSRPQVQGNVRTMTRAEYEAEQNQSAIGAFHCTEPIVRHPMENSEETGLTAGFRMNTAQPQQWSRRDQNSVVGPNNEVRTKHDAKLHGQANAHRLGLDPSDSTALLGNKAYNSFMKDVRQQKKGVATSGTGRAGADADSTRDGAMDTSVRLLITKSINNGLIETCNGAVKEGKEATVYHADQGEESEGFDVAVKIFKRIQEFKSRGDYVEGDPRYSRAKFRNLSSREQLELWTEKEFRNLMRASRAGVPVPTPLMHKDNVIFMRFLGTEGWPAPQLRELDIRKGSPKWNTLFKLCLEAVQRLYKEARLVHGDLSEYNIMVVPSGLVDNPSPGLHGDDLQPVLIDFGQAVDTRHPATRSLLERDVDKLINFFRRQGIDTMSLLEAVSFVVNEAEMKKI